MIYVTFKKYCVTLCLIKGCIFVPRKINLVFWKIEGLVSLASGTTMRGTIVANNSAIIMNTGDTLEGRALAIAGAITVDGILAYTPVGCGSLILSGPTAPDLGTTACYALFSGNGSVTNTGITVVSGDIGTNVGLTMGFDAPSVTGAIHPIPDVSTAQCAADLGLVYTYLNTLSPDIELLYPAQFGRNLVLTPHTYILEAATVFTDSLYLNALDNENAVFVIKINGALSTSTYAKVLLINGAQSKNVYWLVNGAVSINNYSVFCGTLVATGALDAINTGVMLDGRALTTIGALNTMAINAEATLIPTDCLPVGAYSVNAPNKGVSIYPNPFTTSFTIVNEMQSSNSELKIYDVLGQLVMTAKISEAVTTIDANLASGIYSYQVISQDGNVQTGKLISQQ